MKTIRIVVREDAVDRHAAHAALQDVTELRRRVEPNGEIIEQGRHVVLPFEPKHGYVTLEQDDVRFRAARVTVTEAEATALGSTAASDSTIAVYDGDEGWRAFAEAHDYTIVA